MFSRTSCSSPDASERPQHQQPHKPQFPAGHTEVVGRPSSQWGVSSENFPLDIVCFVGEGMQAWQAIEWKIFLLTIWICLQLRISCVTFRRLEETDARLDLRPVLVVLLRSMFYHQLVHLHRDDGMVICTEETVPVRSGKRHQDYRGDLELTFTREISCGRRRPKIVSCGEADAPNINTFSPIVPVIHIYHNLWKQYTVAVKNLYTYSI